MGEVPRWVLKRRSEERFLGCTDRLVSQLGITVGELLEWALRWKALILKGKGLKCL
jgi:hypothetical protein